MSSRTNMQSWTCVSFHRDLKSDVITRDKTRMRTRYFISIRNLIQIPKLTSSILTIFDSQSRYILFSNINEDSPEYDCISRCQKSILKQLWLSMYGRYSQFIQKMGWFASARRRGTKSTSSHNRSCDSNNTVKKGPRLGLGSRIPLLQYKANFR